MVDHARRDLDRRRQTHASILAFALGYMLRQLVVVERPAVGVVDLEPQALARQRRHDATPLLVELELPPMPIDARNHEPEAQWPSMRPGLAPVDDEPTRPAAHCVLAQYHSVTVALLFDHLRRVRLPLVIRPGREDGPAVPIRQPGDETPAPGAPEPYDLAEPEITAQAHRLTEERDVGRLDGMPRPIDHTAEDSGAALLRRHDAAQTKRNDKGGDPTHHGLLAETREPRSCLHERPRQAPGLGRETRRRMLSASRWRSS